MKLPRRLLAQFLAIGYFPMLPVGVVYYDFFINNAIDRIDGESIALCIIGAPLLFGGALTATQRRPLLFALYMAGGIFVAGSVVGPLLLGRYGLPLVAVSLLVAAVAVGVVRQLRTSQTQRTVATSFDINSYQALVPVLKGLSQHSLWSHYDPDADTLAIRFDDPDTPNIASDSDMTDDGIIVRYYDAGEVIGLTILHASSRKQP
jgi:uncharacterized protein YuzE